MSMQDPIADMLTRIRNAQAVGETNISLPASQLKKAILNVLQQEGYINSFEVSEETVAAKGKRKATKTGKSSLAVELKYYQGKPVIQKIKRISKPSMRVYRGVNDLPVVTSGLGIVIVSTSEGVMTGATAKSRKLGGEILCSVE
ncbi:MAG: 30S ribosomal protein S8 [Gammaproteobacteria bacterium]|nr:30S ribosomal protein S8 [Gammaproteobacteria bacterium]